MDKFNLQRVQDGFTSNVQSFLYEVFTFSIKRFIYEVVENRWFEEIKKGKKGLFILLLSYIIIS